MTDECAICLERLFDKTRQLGVSPTRVWTRVSRHVLSNLCATADATSRKASYDLIFHGACILSHVSTSRGTVLDQGAPRRRRRRRRRDE